MLRGMRKASSNWLGKAIMATVMGILIVSFGIWGIADIFRGFGQSTLPKSAIPRYRPTCSARSIPRGFSKWAASSAGL